MHIAFVKHKSEMIWCLCFPSSQRRYGVYASRRHRDDMVSMLPVVTETIWCLCFPSSHALPSPGGVGRSRAYDQVRAPRVRLGATRGRCRTLAVFARACKLPRCIARSVQPLTEEPRTPLTILRTPQRFCAQRRGSRRDSVRGRASWGVNVCFLGVWCALWRGSALYATCICYIYMYMCTCE